MIDEVLVELKQGIEKAKEALGRDLMRLRTGRANVGMLDSIRVDYYGQSTPIAQMASVSIPEPRLLTGPVRARPARPGCPARSGSSRASC